MKTNSFATVQTIHRTGSRVLPILTGALAVVIGLVSCSAHKPGEPFHGEVGVAVAPSSIRGNVIANAGTTLPVSGGVNQKGITTPTETAVVARIQNGLEGAVMSNTGNFSRGLAQVRTNLPNSTDVNKASGFDQVQLLAYAACSDLTTGTTPLMQTRYSIVPTDTPTTNLTALVNAGIRIFDQHLAGLASQSPAADQIKTVFTNLVQKQSASTSTVAFMSVCIAAQTAGATMLGH